MTLSPDGHLPAALLDRLAAVVGPRHVLVSPHDTAPHLTESRGLYAGRALAVVRPGSTEEVAAVVRLCHETGTAIVPQGGNTGLVGGQIPDDTGRQLVLSTLRLDRIREVDVESATMTCEAGVTLKRAQDAAAEAGRLFPLSLAAEGTATIGGNLATNAGGTQVIAYGNARDLVLGLEVVLADGRVWRGLRKLRKDNTGYDLRHLFIGAEGTLGIITAAVLKLFPAPTAVETAQIGLDSPADALALLGLAQARAGGTVTSFELMARICLDFVLAHIPGTRDPLAGTHPWYVLLEVSSHGGAELRGRIEDLLAEALERGLIADAVVAASLDARAGLWRLRESIPAAQKPEGGSIKHDVSVPLTAVPAFLAEATAALARLMPAARPVPFGHLGDGNIHFNITQPPGADTAAYLARWEEVNALVHAIVMRHGGSISAEHGIGRLKRGLLPGVKDPVELDLMRAIKRALDPDGLFNPGKVL
ncbi:FAD-binding oxidoreductase [Blastochloris sulfoviridis]|uniref:FAD-binding oxidoreductase n=1 Tax=Blastochloris sulfoviridis TaxID=50712 RepID=A0A5M6HWA1_9HYPH|nr:FAD-binding oxidoreductase [Blastochloris sulfoviridis]KAA5599898.1 FAD-binding oxidoreductase [Blastochloris sulfoviridis]